MSGPRNLKAFRRAQALRVEIRTLLEQHPPLAKPLTGKQVRDRLTHRPLPSERQVQAHMAAIRLEAELVALGGDSPRLAQFIP